MPTEKEIEAAAIRGRALYFIRVLANTHFSDWRSKRQIWESMAEFRSNDARAALEAAEKVRGENS